MGMDREPATKYIRPRCRCTTMSYAAVMGEFMIWDEESIAYIRARGDRYPGVSGIEPEWVQEVLDDEALLVLEPDPKSRIGASRFIGRSPTAGRVLTVIAYRDSDGHLHGINSWPATGADLRLYRKGIDHGGQA